MYRTNFFHVFCRLLFWITFLIPFRPRFETLFEHHFHPDAHRGPQEALKRGLERGSYFKEPPRELQEGGGEGGRGVAVSEACRLLTESLNQHIISF